MTTNEHKNLALGTAQLASQVIDGDLVDDFIRNKGDMEEYRETLHDLSMILFSSTEISYLYVYKMEPEGFRVIFDVETEDTPAGQIGDFIPYDDGFTPYIPQLLKGEEVEPIITNDEYGYLLTAAKPVYNSNGRCVCYAIADVDMTKLVKDSRSFLTEMIY